MPRCTESTPFIFLFEWICVCTRVYILMDGCVFVCLHTCVVDAETRRWASVVFLFYSLPYLGGTETLTKPGGHWFIQTGWPVSPKGSLASAPAHSAMVLGTHHHAWLFCGCWSWTRASCLQFGHRLSPVLILFWPRIIAICNPIYIDYY